MLPFLMRELENDTKRIACCRGEHVVVLLAGVTECLLRIRKQITTGTRESFGVRWQIVVASLVVMFVLLFARGVWY